MNLRSVMAFGFLSAALSACGSDITQTKPRPPAEQPLSKPFVAVFQTVADDSPKDARQVTYTSDGNGKLRVDGFKPGLTQIYNCKTKTTYLVNVAKKVFSRFNVKTAGAMECFSLPEQVDASGLQDEALDVDQIFSTQQLMHKDIPGAGRKQLPKETIYIGRVRRRQGLSALHL